MATYARRVRLKSKRKLPEPSANPSDPIVFGEALSHAYLGASLPALPLAYLEAICQKADYAPDAAAYWEYPSSRRKVALLEKALRERLQWEAPLPRHCRIQSDASVRPLSDSETLFGIGWAVFSDDDRLLAPGLACLKSLEPVSFGSSAMEAEALGLFLALSRARAGGVSSPNCRVDCLALERLVLEAPPSFSEQRFGSVEAAMRFAGSVWESSLPSRRLSALCSLAAGQLRSFPSFSLSWVPRGENGIADRLAKLSFLLPPDAFAKASVESRARARSASRLLSEDGRIFAFGLCEIETSSGVVFGRGKVPFRGDSAKTLAESESLAIRRACLFWPERDCGALLSRSASLDALRLDPSLPGHARDISFAWLGFPERERILSALDAEATPHSKAYASAVAPSDPPSRPNAFFSFAAKLSSRMRAFSLFPSSEENKEPPYGDPSLSLPIRPRSL